MYQVHKSLKSFLYHGVALLLGIVVVGLSAQRVYAASPIFVTPSGGGNGSAWNHATTLQHALATATSGDEIWVETGIYTPGVTVSDTFSLKAGVGLYGGF